MAPSSYLTVLGFVKCEPEGIGHASCCPGMVNCQRYCHLPSINGSDLCVMPLLCIRFNNHPVAHMLVSFWVRTSVTKKMWNTAGNVEKSTFHVTFQCPPTYGWIPFKYSTTDSIIYSNWSFVRVIWALPFVECIVQGALVPRKGGLLFWSLGTPDVCTQ